MRTQLTRRKLVRGVGAVGVAGVAGSALVSADDEARAVQEDGGTALRVAHMSPDTPAVEVHLNDTGGDGGTGTETPDGDGEDDPLIGDLGFSEVSSYNEVEPGAYQMQIVATEGGGILEDIFGGDEEQRVVFDEEVDLEQGATYTVVAFGRLAQTEDLGEGTPTEEETPGEETTETSGEETTETPGEETTETPGEETTDEETPTSQDGEVLVEDLAFGEDESFEVEAGDYTLEIRETAALADESPGGEGDARPLQVRLLEDDISDPGENTSRFRVFHAVPDAGAVTVAAVGSGDGLGEETETEGNQTATDQPGETDTGEGDVGDDQEGDRAQRVDVSPEARAVYSGFATGYFTPESETPANQTTPTTEETPGEEQATPTETPGTDTPEGDDLVEDQPKAFQFVTVEDASEGERSDGGTGGGILPWALSPQAPAD